MISSHSFFSYNYNNTLSFTSDIGNLCYSYLYSLLIWLRFTHFSKMDKRLAFAFINSIIAHFKFYWFLFKLGFIGSLSSFVGLKLMRLILNLYSFSLSFHCIQACIVLDKKSENFLFLFLCMQCIFYLWPLFGFLSGFQQLNYKVPLSDFICVYTAWSL